MTTNFERVPVEPSKRIGIGDRDYSFREDPLTEQNDGMDSRWPLAVASNLKNDISMTTSTHMLPTPDLRRQLELLKNNPATSAVVPSYVDPAKQSIDSPISVMDIKKLEESADEKMEIGFANPKAIAAGCNEGQNSHQINQREENHRLNHSVQPQHLPNDQEMQQHQLQIRFRYKIENSMQDDQFENQNQKQQCRLQNQMLQNQCHQQLNSLQEYPSHSQQNFEHPDKFQGQVEMEFDCLYPRDDHQSQVRFSQSLSVYDNFEDFDYSNAACSPEITNRKSMGLDENTDSKLVFMLQRAKHCWYSRGELKKIKSDRKDIVRALRMVNFDVGRVDRDMYELRGLEAYLSPEAIRTTLKKRRETLQMVFTEQGRQREGGKRDLESIRDASLKASEWFRTRALEIAERDANEALDLYLYDRKVVSLMGNTTPSILNCFRQTFNRSMVDESLHEPFAFMEVDGDNNEGVPNDSTLTFWANSSWAERNLMEE